MSQAYAMPTPAPVATLSTDARAQFISRTYMHLFGAILGFASVEVFLFKSGLAAPIAQAMLSTNWLLILGGFMVVSWLASRTAMAAQSPLAQYGALTGFVLAEALIFVPLLFIAQFYAQGVIQSAATVTLIGFAGLTLVAFTTRKDFSFLAGLLRWGFVVALVLIVAGVLFGFELGSEFRRCLSKSGSDNGEREASPEIPPRNAKSSYCLLLYRTDLSSLLASVPYPQGTWCTQKLAGGPTIHRSLLLTERTAQLSQLFLAFSRNLAYN